MPTGRVLYGSGMVLEFNSINRHHKKRSGYPGVHNSKTKNRPEDTADLLSDKKRLCPLSQDSDINGTDYSQS